MSRPPFALFLFAFVLAASACSDGHGDAHAPDGGATDSSTIDLGTVLRDIQTGDRTHADAPHLKLAPIVWKPCDTSDFSPHMPRPSKDVLCAAVEVPRSPSHSDEAFTLRVARHRGRKRHNALFFLAGGPGGSAVEESGIMPYYLDALRDDFDFIYVDQRGTGGSDYLACPHATGSGGYPKTAAEWNTCAASMAPRNLSEYGTAQAARDLEQVRKRLGYPMVALRGGSYGTRVALEWIRLAPKAITVAVLDGTLPPDADLLLQFVTRIDQGVALLAADCAASTSCRALSADVAGDLKSRRNALQKKPEAINVDGKDYLLDELFFREMVAAVLLGDPKLRYQLPRAIHEVLKGDNTLWNKIVSKAWGGTFKDATTFDNLSLGRRAPSPPAIERYRYRTFGLSPVSPGLHHTITCGEFLPASDGLTSLVAAETRQLWGNFQGVDGWSTSEDAATCNTWPVKPAPSSQREPVAASVPVLLLSGALDLKTPPRFAKHAAETLSKSTHLIVPFHAHSTISVPCVRTIMSAFFLAKGHMEHVDTGCLAQLSQPPW